MCTIELLAISSLSLPSFKSSPSLSSIRHSVRKTQLGAKHSLTEEEAEEEEKEHKKWH